MSEPITAVELQRLRDDALGWVADEIERLQLCEKRLIAIAGWIERTHPGDFKSGLWDTIERA